MHELFAVGGGETANRFFGGLCVIVSIGGDLHQDLVAAWLEVDLGVYRPGHEVAAVTADHVIFVAFFLHAELEDEAILAGESFKVTSVQLKMSVR